MAFVSVSGVVSRVFYNGTGAEVIESFQVRDKTVQKRWTAWFESEHGLFEGQEVEVSGLHSDDVDEWEKDGVVRHSVKRSLNKAKVKSSGNAPAPAAVEPESTWNGTDQSPF
jgi:hypothetical protein